MNDDERASLKAEIAALHGPMLHKRLFVITWTKTAGSDPDEVLRTFPAHLRWQLDLEERGVLFGSGPLFEEAGEQSPNGMTIVRAASAAQARALAETEPYVERGLRSFTIRGWDLNEGSLHVRVRFGTGTFELE
jgi:uncharacterized protein YciI